MQARRSVGHESRMSVGSNGYGRANGYDEEAAYAMDDLAEESSDDDRHDAPLVGRKKKKNGKVVNGKASANGVRPLSLNIDHGMANGGLRSPGGHSSRGGSRSPSGRSPKLSPRLA